MNFIVNSLLFFIALSSGTLRVQEDRVQEDRVQGNSDRSVVTVTGRLIQHVVQDLEIDLKSLKTTLHQQVELPPPPFPADWPDLKLAERQQWIQEFEASENGKAFAEQRKKLLEAAAQFELQLDKDGSFVIYDVPRGSYGLRGRLEKTVAEKNYVFEVFGQMEIGENVDEVLLDPVRVTVTRLLQAGEVAPEFEIVTFDGKANIDSKLLIGKNVLLSFWSLNSPPSLEFSKSIQKMFAAVEQSHGLHLLSVCIDSDRAKALEYVQSNQVKGWHGYANTWDHKMVSAFGVRSIPALFLIGTDGTIKMTNADFQAAFRTQELDLEQIVINGIENRKSPNPTDQHSPAGADGTN